jgi:DNA helicase-2/ATP-dependent DNA helicase PcrA
VSAVTPTPGATSLLAGLDAQQREAVTTVAGPLAVIAAAGSGKTMVLTRRIAHRVLQGDAEARHVLALTFTRDAAGELKRRLRRLDLQEPIEAGTFHAVALRLLTDRALAANTGPPHLAPDRGRLVRECLTQLRLQADAGGALADLDWARARRIEPSAYEAACRRARRRSAVPASRFAEFALAYSQLKQRRGVVDFDDLLAQVVQAMATDPQWAEGVRWRYRHFFVDEAQDLNPLQHAMLEALRGGRSDLCLVGDPRQAIYGWNGADPALLAEVERTYPGVTVVRLGANYRCTPQVVHAGTAILTAAGQPDDTESQRPGGAAVAVRHFTDEMAEAHAVAAHIRGLAALRSGRDLAVLARTNEQLALIDRALTEVGVSTERSTGRSPLDRALAATSRCTREQLAEWAERAFTAGDEIERRVAEEADRFLASGATGGFRAWVEARTPFDDLLADDRAEAVSLLTFHAAKGREWWGVVVVGVEEGLAPHSSAVSEAQLAEEARLLHVAVTRAAEHLVVTHAHSRSRRPTQPSRWLAALAAAGERDGQVISPPARPPRQADPLVPYREWRTSVARASGQPDTAVCSDRVLRSLAAQPPASVGELAKRLGITETAAARLRPLPHAG